jgi:site-specific recombinase XerD
MMLKLRAAKAGIDKRVHPHGLRHTLTAELK